MLTAQPFLLHLVLSLRRYVQPIREAEPMLLVLHELLSTHLRATAAPVLDSVQHMLSLIRHGFLHELQELFCYHARLTIAEHSLHHLIHLLEGHFRLSEST